MSETQADQEVDLMSVMNNIGEGIIRPYRDLIAGLDQLVEAQKKEIEAKAALLATMETLLADKDRIIEAFGRENAAMERRIELLTQKARALDTPAVRWRG